MNIERENLAAQLKAAYPEGLTGIFICGTTRRHYLLERSSQTSGKLIDTVDYANFMLEKTLDVARLFYAYGGQHFIATVLWWSSFESRGPEIARVYRQISTAAIGSMAQAFYEAEKVTPIFLGLDTWLAMPPEHLGRQLAEELLAYKRPVWPDSRTIVWDYASLPAHTFQHVHIPDPAPTNTPEELLKELYPAYSRAIYGTYIPHPHLYIGSTQSGTLRVRSPVPLALSGAEYCRFFYVPYPTMMLTEKVLATILADLLTPLQRSMTYDYRDKLTPELIQAERERIQRLIDDPSQILGLSRQFGEE